MIYNYLKIAIRNISKNKLSSFINVFGLALSMSIGLIIILFVSDLFKYDGFHENRDQVYRITSHLQSKYQQTHFACSPVPLAKSVYENYPGIRGLVTLRKASAMAEYQGKQLSGSGLFASQQFFELFSYHISSGNSATVLADPYSIVLKEEFAKKMFDDKNPIGETLDLENLGIYKITGVIKEEGHKSHLQFDFLLSYNTFEILNKNQNLDGITISGEENETAVRERASWQDFYRAYAYLLLDKEADIDHLTTYLNSSYIDRYSDMKERSVVFEMQPLLDICPGKIMSNEIGFSFPKIMIIILGAVAMLIVILASFNYTNLTLARSLTRSKEVGIRKVLGANRIKIIFQYIIESVIISMIALLIGVLISQMIIPTIMSVNPIMYKVFSLTYNLKSVLYSILFSLFVGVIAGLIPSLYLSSIKPVKILKGVIKIRLFGGLNLRKILLGIQFVVSIIFVVMTVLLARQIQVMKNTDLGFEIENRMVVELQGVDYAFLTNEIISNPNVLSVAASSGIPVLGDSWSKTEMKINAEDESTMIIVYSVSLDFFPNMKLEIIAGRNFDSYDAISDEKSVILNQAALGFYGLGLPEDAVGKTLFLGTSKKKIIGVVKNYFVQSTMEEIPPVLLRFVPNQLDNLIIHYHEDTDKDEMVKMLKSKWDDVEKVHHFRYSFMDESLGFMNKIYSYVIKIVAYISFLAIAIACLGLLGMMAFNTQSRLKEIGIRKVFGISRRKISLLLAKDYIILILISSGISMLIIWLISAQVKMMLPNSIGFDPLSIILGYFLILLIVAITILSQTRIAEKSNPIEALMYE